MNENPFPYSVEPTPIIPTAPIASTAPDSNRGVFDRRINRLGYFLGQLYLLAPLIVFFIILFLILPALNMGMGDTSIFRTIVNVVLYITGMAIVVTTALIQLSLHIRRLHDLGHRWPWILLMFVPLVNFVFPFYLYFAPGQPEANKYGDPITSLKFLDVLGFTKPE